MNRLVNGLSRLVAAGIFLYIGGLLTLEVAVHLAKLPDLSKFKTQSQVVLASDGEALSVFLTPSGRLRLKTRPEDVDQRYIRMLIAYEDKRFFAHRGFDLAAIFRATYQAIFNGKIVSGASTLTMQVVRLLEPRQRTIPAKIEQLIKAVKLERHFSKQQILKIYLTIAPYGGNIEGVRAAALSYFGKEPGQLSLAQAALLTAIPQAPEARRPDRKAGAARVARDHILQHMTYRLKLSKELVAAAQRETAPTRRKSLSWLAPHLSNRMRNKHPDAETVSTLIDRKIQNAVQNIARDAIGAWEDSVNIAAIVVRNKDSAVLGYLGGVDFLATSRSGQIDLVQSVRSPGSALKPFIYAIAFEELIVHPDTIITDEPIDFSGYTPGNSTGSFEGELTVRRALVRSINTTSVMLLAKIGTSRFLARLRSVDAALELPVRDSEAGLAVALGGAGISLQNLTWLYTALANRGSLTPLRFQGTDLSVPMRTFLSAKAAGATTDILADVAPPPSFGRRSSRDGGRRIAFKTGTSFGFRDAWAIGYDADHTVGVWIGRPDGAPHLGTYGATAAAPILFRIFDRLPAPMTDVTASSGDLGDLASPRDLPRRLQYFKIDRWNNNTQRLKIQFPGNGAVLKQHFTQETRSSVPLVAAGGTPPYHWIISGSPQEAQINKTLNWIPPTPGRFDVTLIDRSGQVATSSFWID